MRTEFALGEIKSDVGELKEAFGLVEGKKKPIAFSSATGSFWRTWAASGLSGAALWAGYKFLVINGAGIMAFVHAMNQNIVNGKL